MNSALRSGRKPWQSCPGTVEVGDTLAGTDILQAKDKET